MLYDVNGNVQSKIADRSLPAIQLEGVGKVYKLYHRRKDRFLEAIDIFNRNKTKYANRFYALRDIDLEIQHGETVGIIGSNGSGKSTLLSIIAGVIQPSFGRISTRGRISSLLELGTGFNPDLTGLENIYFHGTTSGLGREEMDRKREDIISFADIGEYINQPVKTYSSGMFVRLAFAVSICIDPDILIVDEALSVGDMQFQAKCMTAIDRIRKSGATVLFVAHDLGAIKSFCQRAVYLVKGRIKKIGNATDIVEHYLRDMNNASSFEVRKFMRASGSFPDPSTSEPSPRFTEEAEHCTFKTSDRFDSMVHAHRFGIGGVRIRYVELTDEQDQPLSIVPFNSTVNIRVHLESQWEGPTVVLVLVKNSHKIPICEFSFRFTEKEVMQLIPGDRRVLTYRTTLPLGEGIYSLEVKAGRRVAAGHPLEVLDGVHDAITFRMTGAPGHHQVWASVYIPHTLQVQTPAMKSYLDDASKVISLNDPET
jgi:lipopolysaccharide transport system ATP-binding protein